MKHIYSWFFILLMLVFANVVEAVQLSGTYTINPASPATTTNFQNIRSAVTYMTSTSARVDGGPANTGTVGVSGPVLFNLSAATYTEQVTIPAITGSSTTNTITFKGVNQASTIFTFSSADANNRHTLKMNLCANVTFRDMTIRGTGTTYAWVVHIMGANSNNNKIKNCTVEITGTGTTSTSTNFAAIVVNNSATSATTGARIDGTEIDSNFIRAGYYGIIMVGTSGNLHVAPKIRNNHISNTYYYGSYLNYINGVTYTGNYVRCRSSNTVNMGLYMLNSTCTAPNRHIIAHNKISGGGQYAIYITSSNNLSGNKGFIFNNVLGALTLYDYPRTLGLNSSSQWAIYHNSVNIDKAATSSNYSAVYINGGSGNSFINNVCAATGGGLGLPLYASSTAVFDTINYNAFYRSDTSNNQLVYIGVNHNSGSFIGASGQNQNSIFVNPSFPHDTNLVINNACLRGMSLPAITTDFLGQARAITPSIGAYEITPVSNDLQVLRITRPSGTLAAGPTDLDVLVRNVGTNTISSFNLSYVLNNGTPVVYNWSGTLNACDTISVSFTGSQQPTISSVNNFTIYSSSPNSSTDNFRGNDTIRASLFLPLSGNYNIGGTSPNFAKLSDAVSALYTAGMAGPVVFTVQPGTYTDQVALDNNIVGLDSINTITIQGTNRDSCIILHNDNYTTRHIIRIGQSYVRLANLTLRGNNASFGWGVHISKDLVKKVQIKNCRIEFVHPNALTSTSDNYVGVVMIANLSSLWSSDLFSLTDIEIDSNIFTNGYAGVYHFSYYYSYYGPRTPSFNLKVRNNTFNNHYYYGTHLVFVDGIEYSGNTIRMRADNVNSYGLYMYYNQATSNRSIFINNNRIQFVGYSGLYMDNCSAPAGNRGQIINNVIGGGFRSTSPYPVQLYTPINFNIFHNSIVHDVVTTSTTSSPLYISGGSDNAIRNNHFVVSKQGSSAPPVYISPLSTAPIIRYNNYYKPDTAGNYVYLGAWLTRSTLLTQAFSRAENPTFPSDTILIPTSGCLNGDTIGLVTTDINGTTRNALPDIGAYEIPASSDDIGVSALLAPSFPVLSGLQNVHVQITNYGGNNVGSATLNYRLNNTTPVTMPWSGLLVPCDTTSVVFSGAAQVNIPAGSLHTLKVYSTTPNGNNDPVTVNDTLTTILGNPMRGVYVIGTAPSDFTTFASAIYALQIRGVDSAVVFAVKDGTYTEQFTLTSVLGASATNTITFKSQSGNPDLAIIRYNATTASDNFVVRLRNANYFDFQQLSFEALSTSFSRVLELTGSTTNTEFKQCKLISPVVATTSTNNAVVFGSSVTLHQFVLKNSSVIGGSYGLYCFGVGTTALNNNIVIDSNQFTNQYYMGSYMYYTSNIKLRRNNITTNSTYTSYYGIYCYYGDSALEILNNRIFATTVSGYGIRTNYCDGFGNSRGLIANNVITIGAATTTYGIYDQYSSNMRIYNNSVSITTTSSGYAGYFYYSSASYTGNIIRNNIFANFGTGYAIYHYNPLYGHSDFNLLHTNGSTLAQRGTPAATYANLNLAKAGFANNYEVNSIQSRPGYIANNNVLPNPNDSNVWSINGRGVVLADLPLTDYAGVARTINIADGAPDFGAYEVTPVSTPPLCLATPTLPVAGGTQVFTYGTDTVCTIQYDAFATPPSIVRIRQYTNTTPPYLGGVTNNMTMYLDVDAPAGFYNYTMNMYYNDQWLGTNPAEIDLKLAKKASAGPWIIYQGITSNVDTTRNILSAPALTEFSIFTGTDNTNPLPVQLVYFKGVASGDNALLDWQTSSEVNCKQFVVERAIEPNKFKEVAVLKAAGNSTISQSYAYTDKEILKSYTKAYYRLKTIDFDGSHEYSQLVTVSKNMVAPVSELVITPNPFNNSIQIFNVVKGQKIQIIDLTGKELLNEEVLQDGVMTLSNLDFKPGIYFVKSATQTIKLIKQ